MLIKSESLTAETAPTNDGGGGGTDHSNDRFRSSPSPTSSASSSTSSSVLSSPTPQAGRNRNPIRSSGAAAASPTHQLLNSVSQLFRRSVEDKQQENTQQQQQQVERATKMNGKQVAASHDSANKLPNEKSAEARDFVTIIHFNDCYNIEPGPKSSGAAGFLTAVNQYRHLDPLILFSGDILSPSFMSTFTKGEQMIPVLNDIGVNCAVFGNHEFDYGVDNLIDFTKRTTFPWLLSNVIDKETSGQLGDGGVYQILERAGLKIGLIGLIEEEWLSTLSTLDSSDVVYTDYVIRGRELARWLKGPAHGVDYVIALTHFRTPNDIRLADSVPEIDLILGGHDHDYEIIERPNCHIIKSGTDFREFSLIKLKLNAQYPADAQLRRSRHQVTTMIELKSDRAQQASGSESEGTNQDRSERPFVKMDIERIDCSNYPAEPNLKRKLDKFVSTIDEKMGKVLGQFNCELDGRFSSIRRGETNLGNFVTDIMLASTHADLAILNSGTLRSDRIHPRGDFTMRDLFNILGYIDPIAVLQASGYHIWKALENGVSQWPKLEGRFPQISGCSFAFDPSKPPLERINPRDIQIGEEPLVLDKHYKLTTKAYLASGKDGYDVLKDCLVLVPGDESPDLTTSILNHFEAISIIKSNRRTHHRQSIICLSRSSIKKILDNETNGDANVDGQNQLNDDNNNLDQEAATEAADDESKQQYDSQASNNDFEGKQQQCYSPAQAKPPRSPSASSCLSSLTQTDSVYRSTSKRQPRTKRLRSLYEMEHEQCKLEPKVEGRIKIIGVNYQ